MIINMQENRNQHIIREMVHMAVYLLSIHCQQYKKNNKEVIEHQDH